MKHRIKWLVKQDNVIVKMLNKEKTIAKCEKWEKNA